ncbi:MAG: C4-type zinc ribbon domain-containing protein [Chloroflexota bacterium]
MMGITKQLYQLQEIDLEIDADEQSLGQKTGQLGEDEVVARARIRLASGQQGLAELKHQQRSAENDIDDISSKIAAAEGQLYGGRITNPKELSGLQQEGNALKAKRDQIEDETLALLDRLELAEAEVAAADSDLKRIEVEWQRQQQQLTVEIAQLKDKLSALNQKRQTVLNEIDPQTAELYHRLRQQKGQAVARVEQGICRGCRISLDSSELQQARSGRAVQCSSCGRILFLP